MKEIIYRKTIEAAEKLFNRFGIAKTAMSDIAGAANISRATIFNNFGSKDGILKAVLDYRVKQLSTDISRRMKKEESASGKIKAVFLERIKLLSSLKFITDRTIAAASNQEIDGFMEFLNSMFQKNIFKLLNNGHRNDAEVSSLVNTIFFMLKGIEQGISEQIDQFSISQVEKDIDYFLKIAVTENRKEISW